MNAHAIALHRTPASAAERTRLYVVNDETASRRLDELGLHAITLGDLNSQAVSGSEELIFLPDNHLSMWERFEAVARSSAERARVKLVHVRGLGPGATVAEWIARHEGVTIEREADFAPYWTEKRSDRLALVDVDGPSPLEWFDDIDPDEGPGWLVKGLLPRQGLGFLFGPSGSGKSFIALDLAHAIANGHEWAGRKTERSGVLYIAAEDAHGMRLRMFGLRTQKGASGLRTPLALIGQSVDLRTADADAEAILGWARQAEKATGVRIGLVICDHLERSLNGGDDSNMADTGAAISRAKLIAEDLDCLFLFTHHTGHSDQDRMRGHSNLFANADVVLGLSRDPETGLATLTARKVKNGPDGERFGFSFDKIDLGRDKDGDVITTLVPRLVPLLGADGRGKRTRTKTQAEMDADQVRRVLDEIAVDATSSRLSGGTSQVVPLHEVRDKLGGTRVVPRDHLREACYERGFHSEDGVETRRKAFQRAISKLYDDKAAGEFGGWVWLSNR